MQFHEFLTYLESLTCSFDEITYMRSIHSKDYSEEIAVYSSMPRKVMFYEEKCGSEIPLAVWIHNGKNFYARYGSEKYCRVTSSKTRSFTADAAQEFYNGMFDKLLSLIDFIRKRYGSYMDSLSFYVNTVVTDMECPIDITENAMHMNLSLDYIDEKLTCEIKTVNTTWTFVFRSGFHTNEVLPNRYLVGSEEKFLKDYTAK